MSTISGLAQRLATILLTGTLAVATGGTSAVAADTTLTETSGIAADTTLTEASNGTTVTVAVGQSVAVALPANYDPITATGTALRLVSSSGGFPTGQPLAATYLAVAAGTADLRTRTDFACLHSVPRCAVPQRQWLVHVIVVPASRTVTVTEADTGRTLGLSVGDALVVSLASNYQPTRVTGPALAALQIDGGFPTGQPLLARYTAAQPGAVDVATMTDAACLHSVPRCTIPQLQWIVHVIVTS